MNRLSFASVCCVLGATGLLLHTEALSIAPSSCIAGRDTGIPCRGGQLDGCPGLSSCDGPIHGGTSTCCCNNPAAICPDCTRPAYCFADPCRVNSCPSFPGATCRSDACEDGCNAHFFVNETEVTDRCRDVPLEPCSRRGGKDLSVNCGLGTSGECPGSSYCDIHPADQFATCCCSDPAATCPGCTRPHNCKANPCDVSSCGAFPDAKCQPDYCGGCNARYFVGRTEVTDRCDDIRPCQRFGGSDTGLSCGLQNSKPCPATAYCDVHPTDAFATCCCNDTAAICPGCTKPFNCLVDPCQFESCAAFPGATCRSDYCGGCNARFYVGRKEVTDRCDDVPLKPCSRRGGKDLGVNCGRGTSGECPGSSYCDIHPADRFATCCCNDPAATCPGCQRPVTCIVDPCSNAPRCSNIPFARCRANYCKGCEPSFFLFGFDVTKYCFLKG